MGVKDDQIIELALDDENIKYKNPLSLVKCFVVIIFYHRYYKVMDYDLGYTPQGFVQIWGYGDDFNYVQNNMANGRESYCANYWIDNLIIENKDENPNLVEAGFISSKLPHQDDFLYVDEWDNRAGTRFSAYSGV